MQRLLAMFGLCSLGAAISGCGVIMDTTHRVVIDQLAYHEATDSMFTGARDRRLAGSAWHAYRRTNPEMDGSHHFECGFRQGFVDHLEFGATEPPVLPPRKYWKVFYETPEGHEGINDWFTGYRFGLMAAEQSGIRQLVTIPYSIPPEKLAPGQSAAEAYEIPLSTEPMPEAMPEPMPTSMLILPDPFASSKAIVHGRIP